MASRIAGCEGDTVLGTSVDGVGAFVDTSNFTISIFTANLVTISGAVFGFDSTFISTSFNLADVECNAIFGTSVGGTFT